MIRNSTLAFTVAFLATEAAALGAGGMTIASVQSSCEGAAYLQGRLDPPFFTYGGESMTCELENPVPVRGMEAMLYDATCGDEGYYEAATRMQFVRQGKSLLIIEPDQASSFVICDEADG